MNRMPRCCLEKSSLLNISFSKNPLRQRKQRGEKLQKNHKHNNDTQNPTKSSRGSSNQQPKANEISFFKKRKCGNLLTTTRTVCVFLAFRFFGRVERGGGKETPKEEDTIESGGNDIGKKKVEGAFLLKNSGGEGREVLLKSIVSSRREKGEGKEKRNVFGEPIIEDPPKGKKGKRAHRRAKGNAPVDEVRCEVKPVRESQNLQTNPPGNEGR